MNNLFVAVVGDRVDHALEHRLFNAISFLVGISNVVGSIHYLMEGDWFLFWLQLVSGIVLLVFYLVGRFRRTGRKTMYWPFVLTILAFLFLNTLKNAGSMGGAHYYLIPALVIATMLAGSVRRTVTALLLFNLATASLLLIEMYRSEWIRFFDHPSARIQDVAQNFLFAQIFTGVLVLILARTFNQERQKAEKLLLNILPEPIALELKRKSKVAPRLYDSASVLFTDFVGFTTIAEKLTPERLLQELDDCFSRFDEIVKKQRLEKIKTIGDSYMVVGGIPHATRTHAVDCVLAAFEIQRFMTEARERMMAEGRPYWECRLGINTGPLIAGVIGREKFVYDVWGDTVNTASRLESSGVPGRVNISRSTYNQIKNFFACEYRGKIEAKNKGAIDMFFAVRILPQLSENGAGRVPNALFYERYNRLQHGGGPTAGDGSPNDAGGRRTSP